MSNVLYLIDIVAFLYFVAAEIAFFRYVHLKAGDANRFWRKETLDTLLRWILFASSLVVSVIFQINLVNCYAALLFAVPLSLCVYQLCYRYKFSVKSALFTAAAAMILYIVSLSLRSQPENLLGLGINEFDLGNWHSLVVLVSGSPIILLLFNYLPNVLKALKADATGSTGGSGLRDAADFLKSRRAHLTSNWKSIFVCVALCLVAVIEAVVLLKGHPISEANQLPFRVYILSSSGLLSVVGVATGPAYNALLNAEQIYLEYTLAHLSSSVKHASAATPKELRLWEDSCRAVFYICYNARDGAGPNKSANRAIESMTDMLRDIQASPDRCPDCYAVALVSLHNTLFDRFFDIGKSSVASKNQHVNVTLQLLSLLGSIPYNQYNFSPIWLLAYLYDTLRDSVQWNAKSGSAALPMSSTYVLCFENWLKDTSSANASEAALHQACPLYRLCQKGHCPHGCTLSMLEAKQWMCNALVSYPHRIAEKASDIGNQNILRIIWPHEYNSYFWKLFEEKHFRDTANLSDTWILSKLCGELAQVDNSTLFQGAKQVVSKLDHILADSSTERRSREWASIEPRLAKAKMKFRCIQKSFSYYIPPSPDKSDCRDRVATFLMLLCYITS